MKSLTFNKARCLGPKLMLKSSNVHLDITETFDKSQWGPLCHDVKVSLYMNVHLDNYLNVQKIPFSY